MKFSRLDVIDWTRLAQANSAASAHREFVDDLHARGYAGLWLADPPKAQSEIAPALCLLAAGLATASGELDGRFEIGLLTRLHAFMHPLRVAEEIAMLDIASAGRVRWATLAADPFDDRALEQLEILRKAVTGEPVSHDGEYYRFDDVVCQPGPLREGGPPLGIVTSRPEMARWARERGFDVIWDAAVAKTLADESVAIVAIRASSGYSPEQFASLRDIDGVIAGDPEACLDQLVALTETRRIDQLVVRFDLGAVTPEQVAESERIFLDRVLPAFPSSAQQNPEEKKSP